MSTPALPSVPATAAPAGTWKLGRGRAMSLRPCRASVLTIAAGCVWATTDGPHHGPLPGLGDHVLQAGDRLVVEPGRQLVIESWGGPVSFSWDPVPQLAPQPVRRRASIAEPLADFRCAAMLALRATGRLVAALAGWRALAQPGHCGEGASRGFPA